MDEPSSFNGALSWNTYLGRNWSIGSDWWWWWLGEGGWSKPLSRLRPREPLRLASSRLLLRPRRSLELVWLAAKGSSACLRPPLWRGSSFLGGDGGRRSWRREDEPRKSRCSSASRAPIDRDRRFWSRLLSNRDAREVRVFLTRGISRSRDSGLALEPLKAPLFWTLSYGFELDLWLILDSAERFFWFRPPCWADESFFFP